MSLRGHDFSLMIDTQFVGQNTRKIALIPAVAFESAISFGRVNLIGALRFYSFQLRIAVLSRHLGRVIVKL